MLLRLLQNGQYLGMPRIGSGCRELRMDNDGAAHRASYTDYTPMQF